MAKDPAFLFYSSDFLSGVSDLTMEERGQYITLLCLQHQKGHLSEKLIQISLGNATADVMAKFKKDGAGLFFSNRLDIEIEKRRLHTEKQRERATKGWEKRRSQIDATANAMALPLENENENENENKDVIEIRKGGMGEKQKIPFDEIIEIFNSVCSDLPKVEKITDSRKKLIVARIKEHSLEEIGKVFNLVKESDFLSGRKSDWKASFDWIMNPKNFIKILEGNYKNNENGKQREQPLFGRQTADTFLANTTGWFDTE
jgi:hypothetical protein